MLQPKRQKFRKQQRKRSDSKGIATKGTRISFGSYGLKALTQGEITSRQIEAARRTITGVTKRGCKVWIRIFPHKPITKKASEVPMGSGKGSVEYYIANVKPGTVMFEIDGANDELSREALKLASYKLGVKTKIVQKLHHTASSAAA